MKARGVPGFTLLELLVGAALALMIAGTAMGVLLSVQQVQRDAQSRNAIARDAQFAVEHLGYDLQYLGVGVPRGTSLDAVAGELRPAVRIGTSTYLAFVGDLPYPNSELNGVAVLNDIKGETTPPDSGDDDEIIVTSELSPCAPQASGATTYSCQQHLVTGLPIGATAADDCTEGTTGRRLCPWGLGKWQKDGNSSVSLVFTGPLGDWAHRRWAMGAGGGAGGWADVGQAAGPHFDSHDEIDRAPFTSNASGVATVAHLDRVFYSLEAVGGGACPNTGTAGINCVLMRRQCWGPLGDPGAATFPAVAAGVIRSTANPAHCAAPANGTPWETVVNGVDRMTFRYFVDPATELSAPLDATDAAQVQYVEIELAITRQMAGSPVLQTQRMTRRFYLENSGGFEGGGAGSCNAGDDPWCGRP
ncbi:MAG: hypothetical protein A2138_05155 [Deltaproteobacteria bacterium RBG_16_71_12]|nr:MAG: hypothetical protein A2138_05155 [Deltaproteobacteria bacterium RBG_16_71_12]